MHFLKETLCWCILIASSLYLPAYIILVSIPDVADMYPNPDDANITLLTYFMPVILIVALEYTVIGWYVFVQQLRKCDTATKISSLENKIIELEKRIDGLT